MNLKKMLPLLLGILAMLLFVVPSALGGTETVNGANTYPVDHSAVQTAIGLAGAGGTVILNGVFNFGMDGGIEILLPDVTLMAGGGGATITGMGKPSPALGFPCLINVGAIGCKIVGLTITCTRTVGYSGGVAVRTLSTNPSDNPVIIENNTIAVYPPVPDAPQNITGRGFAVWMRATGCPMKVLGNTLSGAYGVYAYPNSGDVIVSGNTITSRVYGMYVMQNTRECIVTDNTVYGNSQSNAIHVCTTPGSGKVLISRNRTIGARMGINVHNLGMTSQGVPAEISDNYSEQTTALPPGYFAIGIWGYGNMSPLNVVNNVIRVIADQPGDNPTAGQLGMYLHSWDPRDGLDQENGALLIKGNEIEIRYPMPNVPDYSLQAIGILLGDGNVGVSNVTVEGNRLTGSVMDGITRLWYGKNTVIAGNDLSGLRTWEAQLWLEAGYTTVKDNVLGFANHIPGFSWGVLLASAMMPPQYQPPPPAIPYPDPYPTENCVLTGNNYRGTGLPGWDIGTGCILLQSFADVGGYGTEVRYNLIAETGGFPRWTGGAGNQVFEYKTASGLVHDNRIVGPYFWAKMGMEPPYSAIRGLPQFVGLSASDVRKSVPCEAVEDGTEQAAGKPAIIVPDQSAETPTIPSRPELVGNYPNPFNPSTTIRFALSTKSVVNITIVNTLGEDVATLVQGEREAGFHEVRFDAGSLPSGVYLCRLQAGSYLATSKLLLLK
jgi:parallel beta-helix repeat protein